MSFLRPSKPHGLRAVDIRAIPDDVLTWAAVRDGIEFDQLPSRLVYDPAAATRAAILSWRWDRDHFGGRSRNIGLALRYCREAGIDLLFVDVVSVDQSLAQRQLVQHIAGLASLYSTIPVIAAYDEPDAVSRSLGHNYLGDAMDRPWIRSEVRAYSQNPTRVTYVGYLGDKRGVERLGFADQVNCIRQSGFSDCVLGILSGRVQMADERDFVVILSDFADLISKCHDSFDRSDYLFSVFLLCVMHELRSNVKREGRMVDYGVRITSFSWLSGMLEQVGRMSRYSVRGFRASDPYEVGPYESGYVVLLDNSEVAVVRSKMTSSFDRLWIDTLPAAKRVISRAAGLSERSLDGALGPSSQNARILNISASLPRPSVEEYVANLETGDWCEEPPPNGTTFGFDRRQWL